MCKFKLILLIWPVYGGLQQFQSLELKKTLFEWAMNKNVNNSQQALRNKEITIMENLGGGKFGEVYKGYDKINQRGVAIKQIRNVSEKVWRNEVKILKMFDHPNIIKYYDDIPYRDSTGEIKGGDIITELIIGQTLQNFIASTSKVNQKGLSEDLVLKLFLQLLDGYRTMHDKDLVHGDIKPQNILVDNNLTVKIIDFGQTKQRTLSESRAIGTPLYSAPETYTTSKKVQSGFKKDVWSLGLVLYEMILGRSYFEEWKNRSDQNQFKKHLQIHQIEIKYPKHFHPVWTDITKKMLRKDHNKRSTLYQIYFQLSEWKSRLKKNEQKETEPQKNVSKVQEPGNLTSSRESGKSGASGTSGASSISGTSGNTNVLAQTQNTSRLTRAQSESRLNAVEKYLSFYDGKHKILIQFIDFLKDYQYPFISNAHKLILVFLCLGIYIASIDHILKKLQQDSILMPDNRIFILSEFYQSVRLKMEQRLKKYIYYYNTQRKSAQTLVLQKIVTKFTEPQKKLMQASQSESSVRTNTSYKNEVEAYELILKYPQVKKLLQKFKQGNIASKQDYLKVFKKVVFSEQYYHSNEHIRQYFYQEDMLVYYFMLIICNLDVFLIYSEEILGSQIPKLREELSNTRRDQQQIKQLIHKIRVYNKKD